MIIILLYCSQNLNDHITKHLLIMCGYFCYFQTTEKKKKKKKKAKDEEDE